MAPVTLMTYVPLGDPALDDGMLLETKMLIDRVSEWRRLGERGSRVVWMCYPDQDLTLLGEAVDRRAIDGLLMVDRHRRNDVDRIEAAFAATTLGVCAFLGWNPNPSEVEAARRARGYVMVQSRPGVTGAAGGTEEASLNQAAATIGCPVVSGFGIRDERDIELAAQLGYDGVAVGSACVEALQIGPERFGAYGSDLRRWNRGSFEKALTL